MPDDFDIVIDPDGKPAFKRPRSSTKPIPDGYSLQERTPLVGADPSERRTHQVDEPSEDRDEMSPVEQAKANAAKASAAVDKDQGAEAAQMQAYRAERAQKPWFHIPGTKSDGITPPQDGDWWDRLKKTIPARLRDVTLIPSHGSVWQEPSDEEAEQAGAKTALQKEQYKDSKWDEALRVAQDDGKTLYRSSRIRGDSPSFMRVAQALSQVASKGEAFVRGADRAITGGALSALADDEYGPGEALGVMPPAQLALAKDVTKQNIERGQRVMGASGEDEIGLSGETRRRGNSDFAAGGQLAGSLSPRGLVGKTSAGANALLGAQTGRGVVSGVLRGGAAAGLGTFASELGAEEVANAQRGGVGMKTKSQGEVLQDAGTTALVSMPMGALLSVPGAVSRTMRNAGDGHAQALAELDEGGGKTSFLRGVVPPPGSDELADIQRATKAPSSVDVARDMARNEAQPLVDDAMSAAAKARAAVGAEGYGMADQLLLDASKADDAVAGVAKSAMERGRQIDELAENATAKLADKVIKKIDSHIPEQQARIGFENEAALRAEESIANSKPQAPDGLTGTSLRPVLDKYRDIVRRMAWEDGELMPGTSAKKFRDAGNKLVNKLEVEADDLPLYRDAAIDIKEIPRQVGGDPSAPTRYGVLLPRHVSPRELDNFIQATDDLANYQGGSGGVDAAKYKEIGAAARSMRDEFKILSATKRSAHDDMLATESMLEATGLPKTYKGQGAGVNESTSVFNQLKGMLNDRSLDSELALRRPKFEKWLSGNDPDLFQEYVQLRKLQQQKNTVRAFNITADGDSTGATLGQLMETMKGEPRKFDAMADALGMGVDARAARAEQQRVRDVFDTLGVPIKPEVGGKERLQLRGKLFDVLIKGGPEWEQLQTSLKPEQRVALEPMRKAATDADKMFGVLGFKPGKWAAADQRQITDGVHKLLDEYRSKGAGEEFNRTADAMFAANPKLKEAVIRMRGERAFQLLSASAKERAGAVMGGGGAGAYLSAGLDMINHRLDALMGRGQRGMIASPSGAELVQSPFGAPAEYANAGAATEGREDEMGKGRLFLAGRAGFDFLYNLAGRAAKVGDRE